MKTILLIFLFITIKSFLYDNNDNIPKLLKNNSSIKPCLAKTYFIKYFEITNINFKKTSLNEENDLLQVNIHSINCNIKIPYPLEKLYYINLNTYSIQINWSSESINIEPTPDIIDGEYKENYEKKYCYLSINSYFLNNSQQKLVIENKDDNFFYLISSSNNLLNIKYEVKNISYDSFILLSFHCEDNSFLINIDYNINDKPINSRNISNSTNIYLNSDFLLKKDCSIIGKNGTININIINKNINKKDINMHLKIIEKNTICLLEKNALNFGFLTTNTTYQYYYAEIFKGEEGELMLHNKRFYGELYGKIIEKNKTNENLIYDIAIYPNSSSKDELLNYNQHYLQLKYNYENTSKCLNGCYLLITYERTPFKDNFSLVGYEFTILSRTWKYTDYITQIIDIPYNEFIISCFNQDGVQNHYYSLDIPDDAEKIIIEVESNFLDIFYDEGRKKVNTINPSKSTQKLNITKDKEVFSLDISELNLNEKDISFTFTPILYYSDIISFYYFRILYVKKNEPIYYPLDSYLGNLCIPELNKDNKNYSCYYILKNNYNESDLKFIISSTNQNEYYKIYLSTFYNNKSISNESNEFEFVYVYNETIKDINYYLFQFEFESDVVKNILISFSDTIENVYPQIYSAQLYFINNFTKINHFKINNKYSLIYQYMYGDIGYVLFHKMNEKLHATRNFKGRPLGILVDEDMNYSKNNASNEFSYYYQLIYNEKNLDIVKINLGEPRSQIINRGQFPLYFYLELEENKDVNIIVNLRLKANDDSELEEDIEIYGYLLSKNDITRAINDEHFYLKDPIKGHFSNAYNIGFLHIIREYNESYNYLLIEIEKKENPIINSYILVDVVSKEYDNNTFWLPINRYLFETFNGINNTIKKENRYHININQMDDKSQVLIELSTKYDEIRIDFENDLNFSSKNITGFKKYRIWNTKNNNFNVIFKVVNPEERNTNYMIRYYYTSIEDEHEYYFNEKFDWEIISSNNENISILLNFNNIGIKKGLTRNETVTKKGIYFLITGTLYYQNKTLNETINTASKLTEHIPYYTNLTTHNYSHSNPENWTLIFENISRNNNYIYDLQLQVNAIISKSLLNEELLIFTTELDLTDIKLEQKKSSKKWIFILLGVIGGILLIVAIFFIVRNIRLKNRNVDLQNEIKHMAFSNDIQKNVLVNDNTISKNESDYESTFI